MKYLITEKQLKTLRKYMKTFINEDAIKGYNALETFPFSKLPETYQDYVNNNSMFNIQGWGISINIPSDHDTLISINSKKQLKEFIDEFKKEYNEEPIFEINLPTQNEPESGKIEITNPKFIKARKLSSQGRSRQIERDWERGYTID